ncbi:SDR family oxidoreductase [Asticcacaulis sp. AND118]|uniref:SDR family oxidoreductase n=1 Tax=Asticcacaulis sp. AND118 TaxID=2840468 RepID=UPI001CFF9AC5|nr:SDR family oxidoreductase [Asticcacaulis sp. AND118]UDF05402.1 SDR family oxidoreductase [Asticcacaulis sp. AND118]
MTKTVPRVALVTGAAKRIGRAVAFALARKGYDIGVHYGTSDAAAQALVGDLRALGVRAAALQADLSDADSVKGLIPAAAAALGPLSLLINNASVFFDDRAGTMTVERWHAHMNTNLLAPVLLAQGFAAQVELPAVAAIVNLIDQRVLKPSPPFFSYGLSKAGLWHATRTLAQELAPRIRVNAVGPGPTLPSIHQSEAEFEAEAASTLLQKRVTPEQIAEAVVFLAEASSVTGQMICVDSGQHLGWKTPDMEGL